MIPVASPMSVARRVLMRRTLMGARRRPFTGLTASRVTTASARARNGVENGNAALPYAMSGGGHRTWTTSSSTGRTGAIAADAADADADTEALIRSYAEKRQTSVSMHVLMQTGYGSLLPPHLAQSDGAREHADATGDARVKQAATVLQARSQKHTITAHTLGKYDEMYLDYCRKCRMRGFFRPCRGGHLPDASGGPRLFFWPNAAGVLKGHTKPRRFYNRF